MDDPNKVLHAQVARFDQMKAMVDERLRTLPLSELVGIMGCIDSFDPATAPLDEVVPREHHWLVFGLALISLLQEILRRTEGYEEPDV
jgi:hypothetical protein